MNESKEAFLNGNEQTGYANTMFVNYNQTHGGIGDLMESLQDSLVVKGIAFTNYIGASSANPYLAYLGTGSAKQTADSLINLAQARDGNLIVDAHSQGTFLTYSAMQYVKENLQNVLKDKKDTILKVGFYGSPVNSVYSSILVKDLYTGSDVNERKLETISNYFRSSINPGDPVGSISFLLGGNGAGINNPTKSENESSYVWSSRGIGSMFNGKSPDDLANSSPHSGYVCVIGCGDGMVTPQFGDYVKKDKTTESLNIFYDERNLNKDFANFNQGKINENK